MDLVLIAHESVGDSQVNTLAYFQLKRCRWLASGGSAFTDTKLNFMQSYLCSHIQVISSLKIGFSNADGIFPKWNINHNF